jgi:hypothetical protein
MYFLVLATEEFWRFFLKAFFPPFEPNLLDFVSLKI